jgi:hypothetical protein
MPCTFGYRIRRKVEIQRLRWATIAAIQERRRGVVARRAGVLGFGQLHQRVDRQTRILAGLDHQVRNRPAIRSRQVGSVHRRYRKIFRPAEGVTGLTFNKAAFCRSIPNVVVEARKYSALAIDTLVELGRLYFAWTVRAIYYQEKQGRYQGAEQVTGRVYRLEPQRESKVSPVTPAAGRKTHGRTTPRTRRLQPTALLTRRLRIAGF